MAIEMLLTNKRLMSHPALMVLIGMATVTIAIFLSWKIFPGSSSLVVIAFTIIPLVPLMMKLLEHEESVMNKESTFGQTIRKRFTHGSILRLYGYLFVGLILGFTIWMLILPEPVKDHIFEEQRDALYDFDGPMGFMTYNARELPTHCSYDVVMHFADDDFGGCLVADFKKDGLPDYMFLTGETITMIVEPHKFEKDPLNYRPTPYKQYLFWHILENNFRILLFVFITSFIYGAGAIFILTWNASIVGYFFADIIQKGWSLGALLTPLLHGIPEFAGFLVAAIAGGVLSVAFIRHDVWDKKFKHIFFDACILFLIALLLLIGAAGIEVL